AAHLVGRAVGPATVAEHVVAVVAHFAAGGVDDAVATPARHAVRAACGVRGVRVGGAVVALLVEVEDGVAALRQRAVVVALVVVDHVGVVALLALCGVDDAVATHLERLAVARAAVAAGVVAVVADLALGGIEDAVATARQRAAGPAGRVR